jgi:hypothetical protein
MRYEGTDATRAYSPPPYLQRLGFRGQLPHIGAPDMGSNLGISDTASSRFFLG